MEGARREASASHKNMHIIVGPQLPREASEAELRSRMGAEVEKAITLQQSGQVVLAARIYQRILATFPQHYDCWHLLGLALSQLGHADAAAASVDMAMRLSPGVGLFTANGAEIHRAAGNLDRARGFNICLSEHG